MAEQRHSSRTAFGAGDFLHLLHVLHLVHLRRERTPHGRPTSPSAAYAASVARISLADAAEDAIAAQRARLCMVRDYSYFPLIFCRTKLQLIK